MVSYIAILCLHGELSPDGTLPLSQALPSSIALLGWVLGPILLVLFGLATVWSSYMLSEVFEMPDGKKHYT